MHGASAQPGQEGAPVASGGCASHAAGSACTGPRGDSAERRGGGSNHPEGGCKGKEGWHLWGRGRWGVLGSLTARGAEDVHL